MSFVNVSGFTITGGEFNSVGRDQVRILNNYAGPDPIRPLSDAIAGVGASHNSQQRFPQPRCHPTTRERIINFLLNWLDGGSRGQSICWLSGPAGVGKSAIAQTIAETLEGKGLLASFFFSRQDSNRNNPRYLMLTIAHGLVVNIPELRQPITERITANPMILEANLKDQFNELIVNPLLAQHGGWTDSTMRHPNLVIIDGLDECGGEDIQTHILMILASELGKHSNSSFPLRFLICSRPEAWLREAFDSNHLCHFTAHLTLDNTFCSDADLDIARYLRDGFHKVSTSPKYSQVQFPVPWPSDHDIWVLVQRACGQFIYAATVLKLVQDGYCHPLVQLHKVLDISQNSSCASLFQELDDLYRVILSTNSDCEGLLSILAAVFILPLARHTHATPRLIEMLLGLPDGQVALTLRPLHSVLHIQGPDDRIFAFHTSFTDFLYDQSQSGVYFLDRQHWHDFLVYRWFYALVEECKNQRLHDIGNLFLGYKNAAVRTLWLSWPEFCFASSGPISDAIILSLQHLDLDALLTAAIISSLSLMKLKNQYKSRLKEIPEFMWLLWEKLDNIIYYLKRADAQNRQLNGLIKHFETAKKGFHVVVPFNIVQMFAMWTVIYISSTNPDTFPEHMEAEMIHYLEGTSSMPRGYFGHCLTTAQVDEETSEVLQCPRAGAGHYHISLQTASLLTLETIKNMFYDSLGSFKSSRLFMLDGLQLLRPHLCGFNPRALSIYAQILLSFRKQWVQVPLLAPNEVFASLYQFEILRWLESFPIQHATEVRALGELLKEFKLIEKLPRTIQNGPQEEADAFKRSI